MVPLFLRPLAHALASVMGLSLLAVGTTAVSLPANVGWEYNAGPASDHFSSLDQITKTNVSQLKQVWNFPIEVGGLESQPIVVGRTLFAITPGRRANRNGSLIRRFPVASPSEVLPVGQMARPRGLFLATKI